MHSVTAARSWPRYIFDLSQFMSCYIPSSYVTSKPMEHEIVVFWLDASIMGVMEMEISKFQNVPSATACESPKGH